ncbi:MAG: hypothetical protein ACO1SV_19625 [Fimbriimonas sp.]
MIGDLLASFCERGKEGGTQCLELWTYPDQTLNVVVTRVSREDEAEYAFPCAPHHVLGVLDGSRPFRSQVGNVGLTLERADDQVRAWVSAPAEGYEWQQLVPVDSLESALASGGFLI